MLGLPLQERQQMMLILSLILFQKSHWISIQYPKAKTV
jgi:hypothetical protein